MSAPEPRPGCPAWCTEHVPEVPQIHMGESRAVTEPYFDVQLVGGASDISLHVGPFAVYDVASPDGKTAVRRLASLLRALGQKDIAAAVDELAALAAGQDGAR